MVKIVSGDGKEIVIRRPVEGDAAGIIKYAKDLFASTDQLLTTLFEYSITVEDEKAWIRKSYENPNTLILIAEYGEQIIGLLDFTPKTKKKNSHIGEFGVSVDINFQRRGIGRALIESMLQWARDTHQIEKVFLNVFHTNHAAIKLYRDMGFIEEGRHVNAAKQPSGEYVDIIQMYRIVK